MTEREQCPRCFELFPAEIHTCSPPPIVVELESRVKELEEFAWKHTDIETLSPEELTFFAEIEGRVVKDYDPNTPPF